MKWTPCALPLFLQLLVGLFTKGKSVALLEDIPKVTVSNGSNSTIQEYAFDEVAV